MIGRGTFKLAAYSFGRSADSRSRSLYPLQNLHQLLGILGAFHSVLSIDGEIRHSGHSIPVRLLNLLVDFGSAPALIEPGFDLSLVQPSLLAGGDQNVMGSDVSIFLEMQLEKRRDNTVFELVRLCLCQLNQPVGVTGVSDPGLEREVDALGFAEALEHHGGHGQAVGIAEFLEEVLIAVNRGFGEGRVEVEGVPMDFESVGAGVGNGGFVEVDGAFEALFA